MRLALLFTLSFGHPQPQPDQWTGLDKWKHFAACAVIESFAYGIARDTNGHSASLRIGAGAVAVVGLGREFHDRHTKGDFSAKDLAWDALGASGAALTLHIVR